jgi:WD40 repeat protein
MRGEYQIYDRVVNTNQRVYFDITSDDRYLITGGTDGLVRIWDLHSSEAETSPCNFTASSDCVNGVR